MVTDGEIPEPDTTVLERLQKAKEDMGLEVHGLLVGQHDRPQVMDDLCTHLHVFKSWSSVKSTKHDYY